MMLAFHGVVRSCRTVESSNGYVMCICSFSYSCRFDP